ncbi:uncharacterized protein TNCV_1414081 [Trichonephila clavipes]|nr:uncharacterized protein TNCV_1414081 [Trichonephila clavipes]
MEGGKRLTINANQVRIYRLRKCDETEIGTGSSDNEVESRSAIERKTQQGGPVRSRNSRGRNDNPYNEEQTRSNNRIARRIADQQQQDQERKGACTRKSVSFKVLVGIDNYKS